MNKNNCKGTNKRIIGVCRCGGDLTIDINSNIDGIFNYYCDVCKSVGDVRFPKRGDYFNESLELDNPIKIVISEYNNIGKEITDDNVENIPISALVNNRQGSL